MEVGILHAPLPHTPPKAALARLLGKSEALQLVDRLPENTPAVPVVFLDSHPSTEPWPMGEEELAHFGRGLSATDKQGLRASKAVTVLTFKGPGLAALATYRRSLVLIAELAKETGGLVWDQETREMFSQTAWAKRSQDWSESGMPIVRSQITIHGYRNGELARMITLGMRKFALPDVVINQVATGHVAMPKVIDLLCQRFVEGTFLAAPGKLTVAIDDVLQTEARKALASARAPGAQGRSELSLASGEHDEGDPENPLVEIVFPGAEATRPERQGELLRQLFGNQERIADVVHDEELMAASARARQTALQYKPRYAKAPPGSGERLVVKAPFATASGGHEYMWVEVLRWQGATIYGLLESEPRDVPKLKSGARVEVAESAIFDYILHKPDGSREGDLTGELIARHQN